MICAMRTKIRHTAIDEYREQAEALLSVLKSIGTDDERAWDSAFPVPPADSLDVVIAALKNRSEELNSTISTEGSRGARRRTGRSCVRAGYLATPLTP